METRTQPQKFNWQRTLLGILISLIALGIVFYFADLRQVLSALRGANYIYLPPAIIAFILALACRSMGWGTLLQEKVPFNRLFFTINIGYLLNNIFPFRAGEIGRALLLKQTNNISFWEVASTILIERTFDMLILVSILLGSLPFVVAATVAGESAAWAQPIALTIAVIVLACLVALHLIARNRLALTNWLHTLAERWHIVARIIGGRLDAFLDGLAVLTDTMRFLRTLGWIALCWVFSVVEVYLVLSAFIPQVSWLWVIFAVGIASLGVAVPSSPGGIGVLEASYVGALAIFGIPASTALAFALVAHALYYLMTILFGIFGLVREGESLGHLYRQVISR